MKRPQRKGNNSPQNRNESGRRKVRKSDPPSYTPKAFEKKTNPEGDSPQLIRLNKYIANAGICSRRAADKLIEGGEVTVNGKTITELGYKVKPGDKVAYNGKLLGREKLVYVLLNKPKGIITTADDPQGRKTVMDVVANACEQRIYPVGRLDRNTTGLLLLTNDGELAERLAHPSHNIRKLYQVDLNKPLAEADFQKISDGVTLDDGVAKVDDIGYASPDAKTIGIEIHIGRNRIVRRIFEHLGYEVVKLDRVIYAGLDKRNLPRGKWRYLTEKELVFLKHGKRKNF